MSKKKKHIIAIVLFYGYVIVVLWITIFSRNSPTGKNMLMHPFWEYVAFFRDVSWHTAHDIVMNMLLFVPYGFLFPCAYIKYNKYTVLSAVILSVLIEVSQLLFQLGWAEIDDIVNNAVGAFIGYKVFGRIITK